MATTTGRYLTEEQLAGYHADGYLVLPRVIDMADVQALRRVTDAFVERSRRLSRGDDVFDLDPRHTVDAPVLRRIKNPADHDPLPLRRRGPVRGRPAPRGHRAGRCPRRPPAGHAGRRHHHPSLPARALVGAERLGDRAAAPDQRL